MATPPVQLEITPDTEVSRFAAESGILDGVAELLVSVGLHGLRRYIVTRDRPVDGATACYPTRPSDAREALDAPDALEDHMLNLANLTLVRQAWRRSAVA